MSIFRVCAGVFLQTEAVGKIIQTQYFEASVRKTQTDVYDLTGKYVLFSKCTLVPANASTEIIKRDNQCHDEIRNALREERDAIPFNL